MSISDIHAIAKDLEVLTQELIAKIPEQVFVARILPIIAGDAGHESLEPWVELAGNVLNKIQVVDHTGAVLFTLPPICVTPITPSGRDHRSSVYEIIRTFEMKARVLPGYGMSYLEEALRDKIRTQDLELETVQLVDQVLTRYGRPSILPSQLKAASTTPVQKSSLISDQVGDEL